MTTRSTILPDDGDPRHGTPSAYCNLRCRCAECRGAWAAYFQRWQRQLPAMASDDPRHGLASTYTNHRCRCDRCRGAHREVARKRRARTS